MRKLMMVTALVALVLAMAAPAWVDGPGIQVDTGWWASDTAGLGVMCSLSA